MLARVPLQPRLRERKPAAIPYPPVGERERKREKGRKEGKGREGKGSEGKGREAKRKEG
jgi:hypothetical protein